MKHLQFILFLFIFVLPTSLSAQKPNVTATINKKKILIGEQLEYKVKVAIPDNTYRLTWFTAPSDFGAFVIASAGKIDSTYANGILGFSQQLTLTSFDSGRQLIPPVELHFESLSGDSAFRMLTDSIPIEVTYSPADSVLPFHDIKPIIPIKITDSNWFWWVVAGAVLILGLLAYLIFRKKKSKPVDVFESREPPIDEALGALNSLQQQHLPEKGEFRIYFTTLTDIAKKYISRKSNSNQMHLTGSELIETIRDMTNRDSVSRYASSIRMGDAAKFAKYQPSSSDCSHCLEEFRSLIQEMDQHLNKPADDL